MKPISAQTTVNEAIQQCPESVRIFTLAGIDTCCGGALSISEAARRHNIDAAYLLSAIESLDCTDEDAYRAMCSL
jgi:iron-sulfur cluster repair protein YtfE (RIC family)